MWLNLFRKSSHFCKGFSFLWYLQKLFLFWGLQLKVFYSIFAVNMISLKYCSQIQVTGSKFTKSSNVAKIDDVIGFFVIRWNKNHWTNPVGNYMFKVSNRNSRTRYEICSKLTIKISERRQWGIFIVNFKHVLHLVLVVLLLPLPKFPQIIKTCLG